MNLVRTADGEWTLIDKDILLPHNLVRHAAFGRVMGFPKAEILAQFANGTIDEPPIAQAIVADILNLSLNQELINAALSNSNLILDFSASQSVARHLALDAESGARRISVFLNPKGTDLVILGEDTERTILLDSIEMQYYRLLIEDELLDSHLDLPNGQIRYSNSCRELSSQIMPEAVALSAAIGSHALRKLLEHDNSVISIWRSTEDGEVRKFTASAATTITINADDWIIRTDALLINKIREQRKQRLPVETGGVLIGSYDMQRKIIYVVDTLPPPPDSVEAATHFIRGNYGLKPLVERIEKLTLNNLQYIGEWHSHPANYSAKPSQDDKNLLAALAKNLRKDGNPALVLIAGENENTWHVE